MIKESQGNVPAFLEGGGEMGRIISGKDWTSHPLGKPENWPVALKVSLSNILKTAFPKFIWWGSDLICFYNDAYRPSLGKDGKHPSILGEKAEVAWPEIWDTIKPLIDQVLTTGKPTWSENQLIPIYRNGSMENVYWTFSYSALLGADEKTSGILVTCAETTEAVLNLQRLEESEDQLKFAIDAAGLGTWDYNPLTHTFTGNARLKDWFGIPQKEEIDLSVALQVILPGDQKRVTKAISEALKGFNDGKYDITYTIKSRKKAALKIVRAMGRAWFDENGEAFRFNGTLQDVSEQIKSEQANRTLLTLMENSSEFISLADAEGNISYGNAAALRMLGWGDVKNKIIADCVYGEDLEKAEELLKVLLEKGSFSENIRFVNAKTKIPTWLKWNATAVKDVNNEKIIGLGTISTNIEKERKREEDLRVANAQIRKEEKRFRNIVNNAPAGIAIFQGENCMVEMANTTLLQILDRTAENLIGSELFDILPEMRDGVAPLFEEVHRKRTAVRGTEFKVPIKRKGKIKDAYFDFILQPINAEKENEELLEVMLVTNEVTDYVYARNILAENVNQFRNLVLQSPIAMAIFRGKDLKIEMANQRMLDHFWGQTWEAVTGRKLIAVFPELKDQKYVGELESVLNTGLAVRDKASKAKIIIDNKAHEFYIDYDYLPLTELDGSVSGIMVTATDVTQQVFSRKKLENFSKELEKQVKERTGLLNSANKQLQDSVGKLKNANADLESFAYVSSHDLQEPLRKIQMYSSRITESEKEGLTDTGKKYFDKITVAVSRMRTLIDDLLAFSRTDGNHTAFEQTDLNKTLHQVLDNLSDAIERTEAVIVGDPLPTIHGVWFQMRQVFSNLLGNAIKFSKEGIPPKIEIRCTKVKGENTIPLGLEAKSPYHKITVKDYGIGFPKGMEHKIFEVFQRLHGKNEYAGTGIGLAIVKKIMDIHNGAITAESVEGESTTFTIFLPEVIKN